MNRLPEVRKFLKTKGNADAYVGVKVTFISGKNPDLTIYEDDGTTREIVDLSKYTVTELHELMIKKGFERKVVGAKS